MQLAEQFINIFSGLDRAYGTYTITEEKSTGKQVGTAAIIRKPVTTILWEKHLIGQQGIGIIPINDESTCRFGAIDIDVYNGLNLTDIIKKIQKYEFPLITCRSKSGGCHLYLFTTEDIPAEILQSKLKEMAAVLGYGNCEIYPRQTKILAERGDIGQFINVPYFNGIKGLRYAIDEQGAPISPEDFILLVEKTKISLKQLQLIKINVKEELIDGPPCLQYLITQGFPDGMRGDGLFNLGVYFIKAFPDTWKEKTENANLNYMFPPLKSDEVQGVLKSLDKKDYFYTCSKAPIVAFCNKSLCITRKHGIGAAAMPTLSSLTKFNSNPPIWFLNVDGGGRLELLTEDLQNQTRFQKRCIESLNMMPPGIQKSQWQQLVQKLLETVIIIEAPSDASTSGQLLEYVEKFCTSRVQATTKEELLLGKPFLEGGRHYFRMTDFMTYLERQHFREFKVNKVTSIMKEQLKAEHHFFSIKGKGVNCWSVPEFQHQIGDFNVPDFKQQDPY